MKPLRTIKLSGKTWKITRDKRKAGEDKAWSGYCDKEKRTIYINPELKGDKLLDVAVHEALHAQLDIIDEDTVDRTASSVAKFLSRLGFTDGM